MQKSKRKQKITFVGTILVASVSKPAPKEFKHQREVGDLGAREEGADQAELGLGLTSGCGGFVRVLPPDFVQAAGNLTTATQGSRPIPLV